MDTLLIILTQLFFVYFNIWAARYQAYRFDVLQKPISHTAWSIVYGALVLVAYFSIHGFGEFLAAFSSWRDLWQYLKSPEFGYVLALVIFRLPVFNTALNWYRKPRRPLFYTNPVWSRKVEQSFFNKVWGNWYPAVFFACITIFITLQFYIYDKAQ